MSDQPDPIERLRNLKWQTYRARRYGVEMGIVVGFAALFGLLNLFGVPRAVQEWISIPLIVIVLGIFVWRDSKPEETPGVDLKPPVRKLKWSERRRKKIRRR